MRMMPSKPLLRSDAMRGVRVPIRDARERTLQQGVAFPNAPSIAGGQFALRPGFHRVQGVHAQLSWRADFGISRKQQGLPLFELVNAQGLKRGVGRSDR